MKKINLVLVFTCLFVVSTFSQSCLPEGIHFGSQMGIDNFQQDYPGCTEIEGDVTLMGYMTDLSGLNVLTSIGGDFYISYINNLEDLSGLENLSEIGGVFSIERNVSLVNLNGLSGLNSVNGLYIMRNELLSDITGLNNLTEAGNVITISKNPFLESIEGLENITIDSVTVLNIYENSLLSECDIQSVCSYLSNPPGKVSIFNNAEGCRTINEIADSCGVTLDCLPYGDYYFTSQDEIDNFENYFQGCTEIKGSVVIDGDDIVDLSALNQITRIEGDLRLNSIDYYYANNNLTELNGFENLSVIEGALVLSKNPSLKSITGLTSIDSIYGSLYIYNNDSLSNLQGLSSLRWVGGRITISGNDGLENLNGLENINSVNSELSISANDKLYNFNGLNNLEKIDGRLIIQNSDIIEFTGFESLRVITDRFSVIDCNVLTGFNGLDNLDSIGGDFIVKNNDNLSSFSGLESLNTLSGELQVYNNLNLSELTGLDNVNGESVNNLSIYNNPNLSMCNIQSICSYLLNPGGAVKIYGNSYGCMNPSQIAANCGFSMPCLPFGDYFLYSQTEIDSFYVNYPGCHDISGSVFVDSEGVTSLSGLNGILSIENDFQVLNTDSLIDFTGLNTLNYIGGDFIVGNNYEYSNKFLETFTGLENLEVIGGDFNIENNVNLKSFEGLNKLSSVGSLDIDYSFFLESLTGLENLDSINGNLTISEAGVITDFEPLLNLRYVNGEIIIKINHKLSSLYGLDNINPDSVKSLFIQANESLSSCAVASICDYITSENPFVRIYNNVEGCNNVEEVEYQCSLNIENTSPIDYFRIFPNPANNEINIQSLNNIQINEVSVYNSIGQKVICESKYVNSINIQNLVSGLYILDIKSDGGSEKHLLIKQ